MTSRNLISKKPFELDYCMLRFLTFEEYLDLADILGLISMNNLHIYYTYKKLIPNPTEDEKVQILELKETPLREIILRDSYFLKTYLQIIELVTAFKEDFTVEYIFEDNDRFMEFRQCIMDMNLLKEEKVFKNEELQEGLEIGKKMQQDKSDALLPEDIITSVVALTSNSFEDVLSMSIYQVYAIYARLNSIMNYKTTTLFATVSSDVNIEAWNKHINLLEKENTSDMKRSEFENKFGGVF